MENKKLFTKSENFKSEYCCSIIKLGECFNIEGKDKIQRTKINGEDVVISKKLLPGTIMFYASNETQLDKDFLGANNLFESSSYQLNSNANEVEPYILKNKELKAEAENLEKVIKKLFICSKFLIGYDSAVIAAGDNEEEKSELETRLNNSRKTISKYIGGNFNEDSTLIDYVTTAQKYCAEKKTQLDIIKKEIDETTDYIRGHVGFFNKTGRVRSIRLGGIQSMGYLFTLDELAKYNPNVNNISLNQYVGEDFDTIEDKLFIKAYVPFVPERRQVSKVEKRNKKIEQFDRMVKGEFSFHYDTQMLAKCIGRLKPSDVVTITSKLHGCVEKHTIVNTMEYGDKTIGEIVDNKINCHIKAYDTDTNEIVYVPIDNFYTIPNDGEWYEIELENGKKITITGNNPIWLPELGIYRRVDELNGDEKILFSDD